MVTFDPTIQLGHIVELAIVAIGAIGVIFTMRAEVQSMKDDVADLRKDVDQITDVLTTLARQDERLKSLEHRAEALERS